MAEEIPPDDQPVEPSAAADGADAEAAPGPPDDLQRTEEALASVEDAAEAVQVAAEDGAGDHPPGEADDAGDAAGMDLPDFTAHGANGEAAVTGLNLLGDVALRVKVELGRTRMYVEDVLRLDADAVIELDKAAGDPVDIFVNDRHVARGEVLVLNDNFCVRVSEIIKAGAADEDP